jgi:glycosyltransferase involved in cell wall biosynthesis
LDATLKKESRELGVEESVQFKGRVDDVVKYLNLADAFVLSSRWEGFGLVVAEAMACELPVVSTNTGGPSEIIKDEETGLLAQRKSPVDLANKMQNIMDMSPEERLRYGKAGRDRVVNQFSITEITNRWVDIYQKYQ